MTLESTESIIENILFSTKDPECDFNGKPSPAITSILYQVCDNNVEKFNECNRIIDLMLTNLIEKIKSGSIHIDVKPPTL